MKPYANNFEKLKAGTLFRSIKKENSEPENIASGQVSKELRFLQRQSQYVTEIERVLKELQLTVSLIGECRVCVVSGRTSRQDLLAYYQGVFLTLVHQMKDKIMQLVHLMTEEIIPEKPSVEKDISVSDLLQRKIKKIQDIRIEEEIKQWEQENPTSKIAVVLRKRTHYHHRVSGLKYDDDFLKLNFTDIVSQPDFQQNLTIYRKERIEKIRIESMERLFSGASSKAEDTLKEIEENIEKISNALVTHFNLPISQEELEKIINNQNKMLESFDIVNRNSVDKIPEPFKKIIDASVKKTCEKYKDQISAIYLVGSLGRGEYEEGYSDINLYIVFNVDDVPAEISKEEDEFNLKVFTEARFMSEQATKYRVIAKADGILLYGTDLTKNEKLPKAGLLLALILNDDILETLNVAEKWMEENPTASPLEISKKSRRLAKRIIDFIYGVIMSNKPQYTASRKERVEKINEMYPENRDMTETLMGISRYGVGEFESFKNTIEGFRPKAEENLKRMQDVKDGTKKQ